MNTIKSIILSFVLALAVASPAMAWVPGGVDPDSIGPIAGLGKNGTGSGPGVQDTTEAIYVGDYNWIRVWVTADSVDTAKVVCQRSYDGAHWTNKDSTATSAAAGPKVMYDSTYIRAGYGPGPKTPRTPFPWMRYILKTSYTVDGDSAYVGIRGARVNIDGER